MKMHERTVGAYATSLAHAMRELDGSFEAMEWTDPVEQARVVCGRAKAIRNRAEALWFITAAMAWAHRRRQELAEARQLGVAKASDQAEEARYLELAVAIAETAAADGFAAQSDRLARKAAK
ncbi:hypothetical protein H8Z72_22710 (plasmid) [Xanthomonas citri pv. citri]|uniref:hypothetical protein n=1 Tax=Xanthomonas citri TaxID=346 RepID=UPI0019346C53|nr:hypothetical protein [Xanthomonas citri]QRD62658.1 hypothetical protein H8Z74_23475 [Xanthomonas citri pv. citri]QRD67193.1 hypothetical protein H8Z73_22455 [Xanthomonas citri pv. citri]QRD71762.1 hypothetical protein H8Z72_22710 [Xanthomonas citri pv. citri]